MMATLIQIAALGVGIGFLALWVDHLKAISSRGVSTRQVSDRQK
jgi:hypothetical protein